MPEQHPRVPAGLRCRPPPGGECGGTGERGCGAAPTQDGGARGGGTAAGTGEDLKPAFFYFIFIPFLVK